MIVTVHRPTCTCSSSPRPELAEGSSSSDPEVLLDHERLDAYRVADQLDVEVVAIARGAPRGHGWLADQAQRASASAGLNLVEAAGLSRARTRPRCRRRRAGC